MLFNESTPVGDFLESIKLGFLEKTLTTPSDGRVGVTTLGQLESMKLEELSAIIPDP